MDELELFAAATEIESPHTRKAWLREVCAADVELRRSVEALLDHYDPHDSFLEQPLIEVASTFTTARGDTDTDTGRSKSDTQPASVDLSVDLKFLSPTSRVDGLGKLGDYEILDVIGQGGMGVVLLGFDAKLERQVAIKVLSPGSPDDAMVRERFLREARLAAAVPHPNVVATYSVEDGDVPFIVMEYVPGETLSEFISCRQELNEITIVSFAKQIAAGLAASHRYGLIHRDIKPGNVLIESGTQCIKLTDFGLATRDGQASLTRTGTITGTPQYMSPEQAMGRRVDHRTDLFSLGSTLYAMGTGKPPFELTTLVALARQICDEPHLPMRERNASLSEWLSDFVDRLLAKDPGQRFQSATEVAQLLEAYHQHLKHPSQIPAPGFQKGSSRSASPRWWFAVVSCLLLITIGLELFGVTGIASTVIRLAAGQGTLVIRVVDPDVKVTVKGEGVAIRWDGNDLSLRPGDYDVVATKDDQPIRRELISISRNDKHLFDVAIESGSTVPSQQRQLAKQQITEQQIAEQQTNETAVSAGPAVSSNPIAGRLVSPDWQWSEPMNLGPHVNSSYVETRGWLTDDELRMVFSRLGKIWEATRSRNDVPFEASRQLGPAIQGDWNTKGVWLSPDGRMLAFDRAGAAGPIDTIMFAHRASVSEPFAAPVDSRIWGLYPSFTEDQRLMVFGRATNQWRVPDQRAMWSCRRRTTKSEFNETDTEVIPFDRDGVLGGKTMMPILSLDGRIVCFSTTGTPETSRDANFMWIMVRDDLDGNFGPPVQLVLPFQRNVFTFPCFLSRDGHHLYVHAKYPGRDPDLYQVTRVRRTAATKVTE